MTTNESPRFVAQFADGEETRMTVFTTLKNLDVVRGVRLAKYAYYSRKGKRPPPIVKARFESNGQILETYSAVDLEDIDSDESDDQTVERLQEQLERRAQEELDRGLDEAPWEEQK